MEIYVDADACPVTAIVEKIAKKHHITVHLFCDTNHVLTSDYSKVYIIGAGADAVDLAVINHCKKGDVIVTQDYGVAALALGKGAYAIHQSGNIFDNKNIDGLLTQRYTAKKARLSHNKTHIKGPKKRTAEDDKKFSAAFESLIQSIITKTELI